MSRPRIAIDRVDGQYTATLADVDAGAELARDLRHWMVGWRATSASAQSLYIDCGTAQLMHAVWLHQVHAASVDIATATTWGSWTARVSGLVVPTDWRVQRRKALAVFGTPVLARYARITCIPSGGYCAIGAAALWATVVDLPARLAAPYRWTVRQSVVQRETLSGGMQVLVTGPPHLEIEWSAPPWTRASGVIQTVLDIWARDRAAWCVIDEQRGDPAHVYLVERVDELQIAERQVTVDARLVLREVL